MTELVIVIGIFITLIIIAFLPGTKLRLLLLTD